ncbi:hypothetical protein ACWUXD_01230 [Klebsiella pneumoniae]|uniref:hypothetical protein n=1 Tax=Klebsiella sp. K5-310 TaxID=2866566 RepID=UPI0024DE7ACE|nr:hypothetical protein [Klebsiella sp. K5-310]MDK1805753.1 hypothetical protein [Klebsiella sp. K5-310]HCQ6565422.1 hypothetical protein [Klebsiella pneumoniae]
MTKSTITRERLEKIAAGRVDARRCNDDEIAMAITLLAAMDSEPVAYMVRRHDEHEGTGTLIHAEYLQRYQDRGDYHYTPLYRHAQPVLEIESEPVFTLEVARADYKGQKLGNHFGFITLDAARELKEGNYQLYTAQPAPVVPDDVLDALQKVARIRLDMNDFDGDRRGIADCLCDAEEALIEVVNRCAAMLAAAPQEVK